MALRPHVELFSYLLLFIIAIFIKEKHNYPMVSVRAYKDAEILDELITRVLCDTQPARGKADGVYLFGETKDNEASVLAVGEFLYRLGRVRYVLLCGFRGGGGYPGFESWKKKLIKAGVSNKKIIDVPPASDFPPSTDAEAFGLIRFAKKHGLKTIYIAAPPIHQLRAFVSSVSATKRERSKIRLFNFVGFPQRYEDHIVHSQGIQRGTRSNLIRKELKKVERYFNKGDLESPEEILKYMNKRDD